jgi:DNA-binding transcriptional LysR family regulator
VENFRLKVFRAVAAEISFRKAAEVLHLSQPAVSQQVRLLEEEAGVLLFDRGSSDGHGSQIALTEAGRVLLRYATTAATMTDAQRALAALNDDVTGELRLGASTTVAQYVWSHGPGGRNDGEAGAGIVDRAAGDCHGLDAQKQAKIYWP